MRLFLLRHGVTAWNLERRIQGRTDIALTEEVCTSLKEFQLSSDWMSYRWVSSPLKRAQQTAALLGAKDVEIVPALIETHWGQFEGLTLDQVEQEIVRLQLKPGHGLDFTPPGGESPRMVGDRFLQWLLTLDAQDKSIVAVTHKGVIRAAISLATGWDMKQKYSTKIDWTLPIAFDFDDGLLSLHGANRPWL